VKQTVYIQNYETIWLPSVEPEHTIKMAEIEWPTISAYAVAHQLWSLMSVQLPEVYEDYNHADRDAVLNKIVNNINSGHATAFANKFDIHGLMIDAGEYQLDNVNDDNFIQAGTSLEASISVAHHLVRSIKSRVARKNVIFHVDKFQLDSIDKLDSLNADYASSMDVFNQCKPNLNYWHGQYSIQLYPVGDLVAGEWKPYSGDDIKATLAEIEMAFSIYRLRDSESHRVLDSTRALLSGD
jgi:hypothetical protein